MKWHYLWGRIKTFRNWYLFVPPFSRIWKKNRIARLRNGLKVELRDIGGSDFFILMEIAFENIYKLEQIRNPKVVLDLGANVGFFSLMVAKKFPQAIVYAVEPEAENYRQLCKHIAMNKLTNVVPMNVAVAKEYGSTVLYLDETNHGCHSVQAFSTSKTQIVPTVPLSHFPKFDALKCDIEGAEHDIFTEIPRCSYIGIEVHGESAPFLKRFPDYSVTEGEHSSFVLTHD